MRLVSMLVMLGVIGLTIERNAPRRRAERRFNRRRRLGRQCPARRRRTAPAATEEAATARTDESGAGEATADRFDRDPEEIAAFRREIETVADGETLILPVEMPAYWRLLEWVVGQSTSELAVRQPRRVTFQELRQSPDKYRGELVELDLNIRQVARQRRDGRE